MATPDAYGNYTSSMIPSGTIQNATDVLSQNQLANQQRKQIMGNINTSSLELSGLGKNRQAAEQKVAGMKLLEKPKAGPEARMDINSMLGGTQSIIGGTQQNKSASGAVADVAGNTFGGFGKAGTASIIGGAAGIGNALGNFATQSGNEQLGGAVSGMASGASAGMAFGPWGAAAGAVIGGLGGWMKGKQLEQANDKAKKDEKEFREKYNKRITKLKEQTLGQADDLDAYDQILNTAKKKQGLYRKGGILKYGRLDVAATEKYLNDLKTERYKEGGKLKDKPIISFAGGGVMDNADKPITRKKKNKKKTTGPSHSAGTGGMTAPVFKKGGKAKMCKKGCSCMKCGGKVHNKDTKTKGSTKVALIFRRGGKLDLSKENVIVDGPSHEEFNKTGVKGDKGLPVVKNGKKIAEIESDELVINAKSSKHIEDLAKRAKKGDKKAEAELGEIVAKELAENTYDYSNVMD